MHQPTPQSLGRALFARELAALGVIAVAATIALMLQLAGARSYAEERRVTDLALAQPLLVARVAPLAGALMNPRTTPGETMRARNDLGALIVRIETAHDALRFAAAARSAGAFSTPSRAPALLDSIDAPLRAFLSDAEALVAVTETGGAGPARDAARADRGAPRRFTTLRDAEIARLMTRLEQIAGIHARHQHSIALRQTQLALTGWFTVLGMSALASVFILRPGAGRAKALLADAQSRAELAASLNRARKRRSARRSEDGASAAAADPQTAGPLSGRVLLCVADRALEAAACDQLAALGLEVERAPDGAAACVAARERGFHLAVIDSTAAVFAARIKVNAGERRLAVLALGAAEDDDRSLHARGVDVVVRLPLSIQDLTAAATFALTPHAVSSRSASGSAPGSDAG